MSFAKNYKLKFSIAVIATVLLAVAAAADPYILMYTINEFTASKDINQLLDNTLLLIAVLSVSYTHLTLPTIYSV